MRAIANSKMPVIAAVGHEIDSTLVDFVADKRASTPTGAAELATIDRREIEQKFEYALQDMGSSLLEKVNNMKEDLSSLQEELDDSIKDYISEDQRLIKSYSDRLEALSPLKVLERGFSITQGKDGKLITSIKDTEKGDSVVTILKDGAIISTVEEVEEK